MAVVVPVISTFDARGIEKAIRDFKKLETASEKSGFVLLSANKAASRLVTNFGKIAAGASIAAGVIGRPLVMAASNMQESISKVTAVFPEASAEIQKWADGTAENLGVSKRAALEAAGTYGNLFQAFGVAAPQAKEMSLRLVELAADMASFNNVPIDDALIALRSGLSGETEPLKRFGVALNDATLKNKALSMGLIDSAKGVLPPAVKAQAAYALVLEQTALQQGDVKRTSDGVAFQMKSLGAQFEDVQAKLGTVLLPAFTKVVTFLNDSVIPTISTFADLLAEEGVGAAFNFLTGSIVNGLGSLGLFGKSISALTVGFIALKAATVAFTVTQNALNLASKITTDTLKQQAIQANATRIALAAAGGVATLVTAAATIYGFYASEKAKAVKQTKEFTDALLLEGTAQSDAFLSLTKNNSQFKIMVASLGDLGLSMDDVTQYIQKGTGDFERFVTALDKVPKTASNGIEQLDSYAKAAGISATAFSSAGGSIAFGISQLAAYAKTARGDAKATQAALSLLKNIGVGAVVDTGDAAEKAAEKFKKFAAQAERVASQQRNAKGAIKDTADAQNDLQRATDAVYKAQEKLNELMRGYGADSKQAKAAQEGVTRAQREAARATIEVSRADQAVIDAQTKLDKLRMAADPKAVARLEDEITLAKFAQADAEKDLVDAQKENDPRKIAEAQIALRNAIADVADAEKNLQETMKGADPAELKSAEEELTLAKMAAIEAREAEKKAIEEIEEAQKKLNEAINGASKESEAYQEALENLKSAQDDELTAVENLTTAKEREFEATRKLAAAELVLKKLRKQLTPKQRKQAEELVQSLETPTVTMTAPSQVPFAGLDFSNISLGDLGFSVGGLATLASGGIVTKPTLSLIGEGGEPEAVIPLSQMTSGTTINVTVNAGVGDPNEIGRQVVSALQTYQKRLGAIPIKVA